MSLNDYGYAIREYAAEMAAKEARERAEASSLVTADPHDVPIKEVKPSLNLLRGTRCYLIGHMEFANGRDWRKHVMDELGPRGIVFFNPYEKPFVSDIPEDEAARVELSRWREMGQWELLEARMKKVRAQDLRLVDISDFLIVNILPKIASWGSSEEMTTAIREKKPLFLSIDDPKGKKATPLWFFGKLPHKYIYDSIDCIIERIKAIDDGIIPMCSDRWRLLKPEYRIIR